MPAAVCNWRNGACGRCIVVAAARSRTTNHKAEKLEQARSTQLLARAREIAERLVKLPPLTTRYTRIALTQKLRRLIDEGVGYGLALEGISAADVARAK